MSEYSEQEHDEKLSAFYRRSSDEQPPAELDAAILAQARRQAGRRRHRRWLSLSTAAVLVLGLSLTLNMLEQEPPQLMDPVMESYDAAPAKRESMPAEPPSLTAPAEGKAMAPAPVERQRFKALQAPAASAPMLDKGDVEVESVGGVRQERLSVQEEAAESSEEAWLQRIEGLLQSGQDEAARVELRRFRERYSDYPLPEALQALE